MDSYFYIPILSVRTILRAFSLETILTPTKNEEVQKW